MSLPLNIEEKEDVRYPCDTLVIPSLSALAEIYIVIETGSVSNRNGNQSSDHKRRLAIRLLVIEKNALAQV